MRDLGKDIIEFRFHLIPQLLKFLLSREDFNPLPNGSDWIDRFHRFEFELCVS